ncbi:uncharacterized protein LOC144625647 [Crassostrea virginica]
MMQLLQIKVFLVFLSVNCNYVRSSEFKKCEGGLNGCCNGFMYNKTVGECTECRLGYFGPMCSIPCPYNSYGRGCQMECSCLEDDCDFAMGCGNTDSMSTSVKSIRRDRYNQHWSSQHTVIWDLK